MIDDGLDLNDLKLFALVVEHGGSGSAAAAPVARRIFDAWMGPAPVAASPAEQRP